TSPYKFYQFWLNTPDAEAAKCLRIFTTWERERTEGLIAEHEKAPHLRALQKELAADLTCRVHGEAELQSALQASEILFGQTTADALGALSEQQWMEIFEGVPQAEVERASIGAVNIIDLLTDRSGFLPSKGEAKRALKEGSISVNKQKVDEQWNMDTGYSGRYLLLQRGKKNYFLVKLV
ncbi:MAG TPA: tyrosine--tRNA ligase, partial [Flavobacteriales bacterium]|nr:tyrosine--tRNA ligase [Flavobacteriales bacterium]